MGMTKLIYGSDFDPSVGVCAELITRQGELTKQASTIFGREYSELKPDDRHVGIHVVALGDAEHYGENRNGDLFSKAACEKYHDTFVKHGHVFRHHMNKQAEKAIGKVAASAYNEPMGRIELFIHADKEKAAPELARLEKEGEIPFSMACSRAGTPIQTSVGMKAVESIVPGDVVLTHKGNWKTVTAIMHREVSEYFDVKFTSWGRDVLSITGNHPVLSCSFDDFPRNVRKDRAQHPDKGWKRRHRAELHRYLKWTPVSELTEYSYMGVPIVRDESSSLDEDTARVLGYYISEGSLGSEDSNRVCFTCNKDDAIVSEIENLHKWSGVKFYDKANSEKAYDIVCHDPEFARFVEDSCGRGCRNKRVPMVVKTSARESKFNFIAAWFNGDGWQDASGMHWSTCSRNLAVELQQLLASVDIPSSASRIDHPEDRGLVKSKDAVEYVVSVSNQFSCLFSSISKASSIQLCDGTTKCRTFISGDYLMVPVSSVTAISTSSPVVVYNFSVEDDESYTVYGLAVHNCRVPNDRCSICGAMRKHAGDASECDHVANHLGEQMEDGRKVGTFNDEPTFFDISFVGRPADRIAWNLKVASALPLDSVKAAEMEGVVAPDEISCDTESSRRKLEYMRKVAEMQDMYSAWFSGTSRPRTARELYLNELRRVPLSKIASEAVDRLREVPERVVYGSLAEYGAIMDMPTFFKYATGDDYESVVAPYMPAVAARLPGLISDMVKRSEASRVCNDASFDAIRCRWLPDMAVSAVKSASFADDIPGVAITLSGERNPRSGKSVDTSGTSMRTSAVVEKLAETYATYQMSAIDAVLGTRRTQGGTGRSELDVEAVVAANNAMGAAAPLGR